MNEKWVAGNSAIGPERLARVTKLYNFPDPETIAEDDLEIEIEERAVNHRGNQFPNQYPTELILRVFEEQAAPWKSVTTRHLDLVLRAAQVLVKDMVFYVCGGDHKLYDNIMKKVVADFFTVREAVLRAKLDELLPKIRDGSFRLAFEWPYMSMVEERAARRLATKRGEKGRVVENVVDFMVEFYGVRFSISQPSPKAS